jgi:acyl carrier protein
VRSEVEIRQMLVDAIDASTIVGLRRSGLMEGFLDGTDDIPFLVLEMDSMGVMELCIAVEVNTGVEIVPGELTELGSLGAVVTAIKERQG